MADILQITEDIPVDDSIYEYEYKEYNPIAGTDLKCGSIVITIESQDIYTHPAESFLVIEGDLIKNVRNPADGAFVRYGNADTITLINNGIMYLFSDVRFHLASHEIEFLQNPGQATTMLGLLKYPDDFNKSQGLNQLWAPDTPIVDNNTANKGDNYGFKKRFKHIISESTTPGSFSFKKEKDNNQTKNPAIFNHLSVRNIYVTLNAKRYPDTDYKNNFTTNNFSRIYGDAASFRKKFFNMDQLVSNSGIDPISYKNIFPLFVFDVTKQSEKLKTSVSDIHIKANFGGNPGADTMAYAVIISDRLFHFVSDGSKITNIV